MNKTYFNETIASDKEEGVTDILAACSQETSSWNWKSGDLPDTITLRRMISLANWAAKEPKRWEAYRLFFFDGIQNTTRIAERLHCSERTVRRFLEPVRLAGKSKLINPIK